MNNVTEFPTERWAQGTAKCLDCGEKWQAVAPIGDFTMECPKCQTYRGVWMGTFGAAQGTAFDEHWVCNCGCDVFHITAKSGTFDSIVCLKCGAAQLF